MQRTTSSTRKSRPLDFFLPLLVYSVLLTAVAIFFIAKRIWFQQTQEYNVAGDGWTAMQSVYSAIPIDSGKAIFAGDSRVLYSPFAEVIQNAICRGIGQESLFFLLKRVPQLIACRPRIIVVCSGINDISQGRKDIEQNFDSLFRMCGPILCLMEIMPVSRSYPDAVKINHEVDSLNVFLRMRKRHEGFALVRVFDTPLDPAFTWDGIHFTLAGYKRWQRSLLTKFETFTIKPI